MLPAFLSLYVGARETQLPSAPSRALQGLLVGLLVTAGFLAIFAVLAILIPLWRWVFQSTDEPDQTPASPTIRSFY